MNNNTNKPLSQADLFLFDNILSGNASQKPVATDTSTDWFSILNESSPAITSTQKSIPPDPSSSLQSNQNSLILSQNLIRPDLSNEFGNFQNAEDSTATRDAVSAIQPISVLNPLSIDSKESFTNQNMLKPLKANFTASQNTTSKATTTKVTVNKSFDNGTIQGSLFAPKTDLLDDEEDFEPWPDFPDETNKNQKIIKEVVPPPEYLLPLFETNLFPLPLPLFQELAPLAYPLKRRVLSNGQIKRFFAALISGAQVSARICAGRKRRGGKFEADREAREVARVWKSLCGRLSGVGLHDLPTIDWSFTLPPYSGDKSDLCLVCGAARHETVKGIHNNVQWDLENGGHASCIKWWAREKALLDS
ncbi:hypothetical protein V1514DRAFT_369633 [Lipomyces japonicus]|uniref:uncharacterized protein n=1 Tax=Lipomyces japonicus TaxID=56871 RepID=UPI0034CDF7AA